MALGAMLVMAQIYIDDWVIEQAQNKMIELFGEGIIEKLELE